jgi:hypothetical protein
VAIRHRDNNVDTSDPALPLLADLDQFFGGPS